MTACINRPDIMSSAAVCWKSAILSVSAWISSVNICTVMTSLSTLLSRTGWGETLESALGMTFSFPFRFSMYEKSLYSHTSSDGIFQGQRQHSTALSLSLSLSVWIPLLCLSEASCIDNWLAILKQNCANEPFLDASDWTALVFHVSKYACTGAIVISFLIGSNASCCDLTYAKTTPLWHSALSGAVKSAIFGRKWLRWFTTPR